MLDTALFTRNKCSLSFRQLLVSPEHNKRHLRFGFYLTSKANLIYIHNIFESKYVDSDIFLKLLMLRFISCLEHKPCCSVFRCCSSQRKSALLLACSVFAVKHAYHHRSLCFHGKLIKKSLSSVCLFSIPFILLIVSIFFPHELSSINFPHDMFQRVVVGNDFC